MFFSKFVELTMFPLIFLIALVIWFSMEIIIKTRSPHLGTKLSLILFRISSGFVIISSIIMPPSFFYLDSTLHLGYGLPFRYIKLYSENNRDIGFFSLLKSWNNTVITNWSFNYFSYFLSIVIVYTCVYYIISFFHKIKNIKSNGSILR